MVADYAHGISTSFLASMHHAKAAAAPASATAAASTASSDDGLSFGDLLDVVNPLQHIPVISTLYRHFTHDTIKPLEKIAGDTLFGGLTGLGSSVADFAFEKITGKNIGDTVLAFLGLDDSAPATAVASEQPSPAARVAAASLATHAPTPLIQSAPQAAIPASPALKTNGSQELMAAAQRSGVTSDVALRALSAYQASLLLPKIADATTP